VSHRGWCPAVVTAKERANGREPGACACGEGTPRCPFTRPMFPALDLVPDAEVWTPPGDPET
jgi:hypothetical protein